MNREAKFIDYLEGLKNEGNVELLENITEGFKTLVEYRVEGSPSEKVVDIMESEEEIQDDVDSDSELIEDGDLDTPLDESVLSRNSVDQARKAGVAKGVSDAGNKLGASIEMFNRQQESLGKPRLDEGTSTETDNTTEFVMEVGEGEVKGKLSPSLLREVDSAVEKRIQIMSKMIDKGKLIPDEIQKKKYLTSMRGQLWRDNFIERGIDPTQAKGLVPSLTESLDEANAALLDFVDTAFKVFSIDKC